MKPETLQLYNTRYEESYDLDCDELYVVWSKLKQLSLTDKPTSAPKPKNNEQNPFALLPEKQQKVSSVFEEVLTYSEPTCTKQTKPSKQGKGTSGMPKHLSSDQVIAYLEQKKKQREEDEKLKRKQEREEKKKEREEEKRRKQLEREKKKAEAVQNKARQSGRGRGRGQ